MYHVSGRAIVATTRRALDDATIQVAVKGALVQKDMRSGLRSRSQVGNRPKMITSPYEVLSLESPRGRAFPADPGGSKDPRPVV